MMLFEIYTFIATLDASFGDKEIGQRKRAFLGPNVLSRNDLLQVWGRYPEIAEGKLACHVLPHHALLIDII